MKFGKILQPGQIGTVQTKNRIVKTCGGAEDITGINRAFLECDSLGRCGLDYMGRRRR